MRVLLFDIAGPTRRAIMRLLWAHGFTPSLATSSTDALKRLMEPFPLFLAAWSPTREDADGLALARAVRVSGIRVPIALYAISAERDDRIRAFEAGVDEFFVDPLDGFAELATRIRALHRRASGTLRVSMRVGRVEMDSAARLVRVDDLPLELTAAEFDVLSVLMAHAPNVVTKRLLLQTMGYLSSWETTNALKQTIFRLRLRLGEAGNQIVAVRGVGYRFVAISVRNVGGT